jgi:hypothetical protein
MVGCGGASGDDGRGSADGGGIPGAEGGSDAGDASADGADAPGDASQGGSSAADSGGVDDGGSNGALPLWDVGTMPDFGDQVGCGDGGGGKLDFSYIWIANSSQSAVSKINTQTLAEEGRYYTRDDNAGNPSRTSVNLSGDVAVGNRSGGLTKFYADLSKCTDLNGNGVIDTSTGAADIRPWAEEECRAWYTPFNYTSQRPVAWSQGEYDPATCAQVNEKVWTTGVLGGVIQVVLVDGETGIVEDDVMVPEIAPNYYGMYGGAVDADGNFWASQLGGGTLMRVNLANLADYTLWPTQHGGYGMTVGASGYVFTCSSQVGRFDPVTETWMGATVGGSGGCMEDANGILWMANSTMVGVDVNTLGVVHAWPLPSYVHGVSIDFEGNVWGVSMGTEAYRVDPNTGTFDTVAGLVGPYTYSDMTGFALQSVGGGGPPTG